MRGKKVEGVVTSSSSSTADGWYARRKSLAHPSFDEAGARAVKAVEVRARVEAASEFRAHMRITIRFPPS
jgi:hypothetical protein